MPKYDAGSGFVCFALALDMLKQGRSMARAGWNGRGLQVRLQRPDADSKMTMPYLYLEYPDGARVPWLASQTDLLAEDWYEPLLP